MRQGIASRLYGKCVDIGENRKTLTAELTQWERQVLMRAMLEEAGKMAGQMEPEAVAPMSITIERA